MSIRIGGSCGGRYSRPITGITCYENRILQNNEHKMFWEDSKFCINNKIFLIVNIDTYKTGGRWRPTNPELRQFVIDTKNKLKTLGANKSNCRFTYDNESDEHESFDDYMNGVRVVHDALGGEFDLGAGNFRTQRKDWYESLAKLSYQKHYEYFDFHMQDGLNDIDDIRSYCNWILYLKNAYKLKIAVTEGNNFYNVSSEKGHSLLKDQILGAELIGCSDFCFVYANWMHNGEEDDDNMSYNWNFNPVSQYWDDMFNFINSKKPKGIIDMIELNYVKPGSKNEETRTIQQIMIDEGYDLGSYGADGIYGNKTKEAILKWQTDNNLKVDGVVGKETWQWIIENIKTGIIRFLQLIARKASYK